MLSKCAVGSGGDDRILWRAGAVQSRPIPVSRWGLGQQLQRPGQQLWLLSRRSIYFSKIAGFSSVFFLENTSTLTSDCKATCPLCGWRKTAPYYVEARIKGFSILFIQVVCTDKDRARARAVTPAAASTATATTTTTTMAPTHRDRLHRAPSLTATVTAPTTRPRAATPPDQSTTTLTTTTITAIGTERATVR